MEARNGGAGHRNGAHAEQMLEKIDAPRGSVREVSGRVEGQTLRGSLQQKRKEEGPKDSMSFEEAVVSAIDFTGALTGTGSYAPPKDARGGAFKGAGVGPSPAYSYSAQVAEVSVDEETGEVKVHKVWAAHDCGRALNPVSVEGQVIGSVWMGLGQAMQEEMVWKDGLLMNPGNAGVQVAFGHGVAGGGMHHRGVGRSGRAVRREGSERRLTGGDDSGDR